MTGLELKGSHLYLRVDLTATRFVCGMLLYLSGESKGQNHRRGKPHLPGSPRFTLLTMCTEVKSISCRCLCQDSLAYFLLAAAAQGWPKQKQETDKQRAWRNMPVCPVRPCQLEERDTHRLLTRHTAVIKAEAAIQVFVETHTLASPGQRLIWIGAFFSTGPPALALGTLKPGGRGKEGGARKCLKSCVPRHRCYGDAGGHPLPKAGMSGTDLP